MSEQVGWPAPPTMNPCELVKKCSQCDDNIEVDEPCIELFFGILGRSKKSGQLMVLDASSEPDPPIILHTYCVVSFSIDNIDDSMPDDFGENICQHCESKLDDQYCPSCGMKQD